MKRAISIGVLLAFAAGCLVAVTYHLKPQVAEATMLSGHSVYFLPCQWTYKDDFAYLWNWQKTEILKSCSINAPPNHTYYLSGDWDGSYWLEGVTVYYYNEYWKAVEMELGYSYREDILFCWNMSEPDGGGN